MSNPSPCDISRLGAVLNDQLDDPEFAHTVDHLSECSTCQTRLQQLAAGRWWWTEGRELLESSSGIDVELASPSRIIATTHDNDGLADAASERATIDFLEPPSHPELLGRLGKYEVECVAGRGGMGLVLKGLDTELNRSVAIKVLSPHLSSNAAARQRFAREARAAAAVVHDHVVAIHGIETGGQLPYLVMPYVPGASLQQFVEQHGSLDVKDIIRVSMQIAGGLSAAHEQGLVHRDIKPGNVLLQNGLSRVLITDFGLARAADDASLTRTGLVAGTPHYMSPEQANGAAVDGQSDLFSLGSVMYFMATGRPPFRADAALAVLNHICHKDARPLQEVNADMPRPVAVIVSQLLEKEPAKRFRSAGQLRELLAAYLAHLQDPSRHELPAQLAEHQSLLPRHSIAIAALAAIVVIVSMCLPGDESNQQEPTRSSATASDRRFSGNRLAVTSPTREQIAWSSTVDVEVEHELTSLSGEIEALERAMQPTPASHDFPAGRLWEEQAGTLGQEIENLSQFMSSGILQKGY